MGKPLILSLKNNNNFLDADMWGTFHFLLFFLSSTKYGVEILTHSSWVSAAPHGPEPTRGKEKPLESTLRI